MKRTTKKLLATLALACAMTASVGGFVACDEGEGTGGNTLTVEFLEGYLDEISLGESIQVRDYVPQEILDYKVNGKKGYTFKMQFGEEVYDLTNRATFLPEYIGDWKMILTVDGKTVEITFTVKGKTLAWADHEKPQIEFEVGGENGTLDFATTLDNMGIEVFSDYEYETFINSVLIGSTNATRVSLKDQTSYTFAVNDIHVFEYKTVAEDGQEISGNFWAIPKTTETKAYIKKDANYPFRDWYGGTSCGSGKLKPEIATDGYYVDAVSLQYSEDQDWAGLRANAALFKKYIDAGATAIKFDVYNNDAIDHTYTVFHHLKEEKLPEGSKGTLKAGEWTTITITKAMLSEAFACEANDYIPIENVAKYTSWSNHGVYGWSKKSWETASNFAFTIAFHNSAYVKGVPAASITFNLDNVRVSGIEDEDTPVKLLPDIDVQPKPIADAVRTYWGSADTNHFNVSYAGTGVESTVETNKATEGDHVDVIRYSYNETNAFAGLRANQKFFANYYYGWNGETKLQVITFDIYNADTVDHTYTLFHHLKEENRPAGSTGTLKAGEWTTITITREMLVAAYTYTEPAGTLEALTAAYDVTGDGVYASYRQTWVKNAGFNVIPFSIALNISNYDSLQEGDKVEFYLDNVQIFDETQAPGEEATDQVLTYWGSDATSPFRVAYTATSVEGGVKSNLATDGNHVDQITYTYDADIDYAMLRATAKAFGDAYRGWGDYVLADGTTKNPLTQISFDIYNADTVDHTYTLFNRLKKENRPEGSEGTLKAGEWTTITITSDMLKTAYQYALGVGSTDAEKVENLEAAYETTEDAVYETYAQTWFKNAGYYPDASGLMAFSFALNISNHDSLTAGSSVVFYLDNLQMTLVDGTTVAVGA